MKSLSRIALSIFLSAIPLGAYQYNSTVFTQGDAVRLATSSREFFRIELNRPVARKMRRAYRKQGRYATPTALPTSLYKTETTTNGFRLIVKRLKGISSLLLLSDPVRYPGLRRRTSFGLRSTGAIKENGSFSLNAGKKNLGPEQGYHFLGSSETINDPELGEAFRISIPKTAVYGYWAKKIRQIKIKSGATLRLLIIGDGIRKCYTIKI